jgi:hypothetical protein
MNIDVILMNELNQALVNTLEKGAILRKLIEVNPYQRGIGKTTALIEFAKKYGVGVVVKNKMVAKNLRDTTKYPHICSENEIMRGMPIKVVIDEGVDLDKLTNAGLEVITGFKTV